MTVAVDRFISIFCLLRAGWCYTKPTGKHLKQPGWGWCVPGCDGSEDQDKAQLKKSEIFRSNSTLWTLWTFYIIVCIYRRRVHELPIDSFVYENCSTQVGILQYIEYISGRGRLQAELCRHRIVKCSYLRCSWVGSGVGWVNVCCDG